MINNAAEIIHKNELEKPKRVLPDVPFAENQSLSKSSSDLLDVETETRRESKMIMSKYKYSTLPRKKKEKSSSLESISKSKFYIPKNENTEIQEINKNTKSTKKDFTLTIAETVIPDGQTHISLYKFYPRHKDELKFNDGDPIQVLKVCEDLWYEGVNLLTGKQGVFPCRYVADILLKEEETLTVDGVQNSDHRQFHLRFLGSVEVSDFKGDDVLILAIAKMVNQRSMLSSSEPPSCVVQVNDKGIKISNINYQQQTNATRNKNKKKQPDVDPSEKEESHFFSLKNVTFCGNHPKDHRYFGFITKHPSDHRFACHIFMSKFSTDQICKIIGDCFKRFYEVYMEYRAPTEDIYLE